MAAQQQKPNEALANLQKTLFEQAEKNNKLVLENIALQIGTLTVSVNELTTQIKTLSALAEKKKAAPKEKKKTDGPVEVPEVVNDKKVPKFTNNKLIWFRGEFKTNEDFRAKYVTDELKALMDKDETITSRKNLDQKITSQSTFVWNYIRDNDKEKVALIETDYLAAKQKAENESRADQLNAEEHS